MMGRARGDECGYPCQTGPLDGVRFVSGCHQFATVEVDGEWWCPTHAAGQRYQRREFERMMDDATRHWATIGMSGSDGKGRRENNSRVSVGLLLGM